MKKSKKEDVIIMLSGIIAGIFFSIFIYFFLTETAKYRNPARKVSEYHQSFIGKTVKDTLSGKTGKVIAVNGFSFRIKPEDGTRNLSRTTEHIKIVKKTDSIN